MYTFGYIPIMVLAVRCEPFACHSVFKKNLVNAMLSKDTDYRYIIKKTQESHTDNSNIVLGRYHDTGGLHYYNA